MNKIYGLIGVALILAIVLANALVTYARLNNPVSQTPWLGNINAGGFNLSNVGTLGVTTLTAGTITVSSYAVSLLYVGGAATSTIVGDGLMSTIGGSLTVTKNLLVTTTSTFSKAATFTVGVVSPFYVIGSATTTLKGDGLLSTIGGSLTVTKNLLVSTTSTFTGATVHTGAVTFNDDVAFGAGDTISFTPQTISVSTTSTSIDWGAGNKAHVTLGVATTTFVFVDPANSGNITIKLIQDGGGSRTVTWPASVKWPSDTAPTLTTAGGSVDIVGCYHDGTNYYCADSLDVR